MGSSSLALSISAVLVLCGLMSGLFYASYVKKLPRGGQWEKPVSYAAGAKLVLANAHVKAKETVVIVTDDNTDPIIANSLFEQATQLEAFPTVVNMSAIAFDGGEPPLPVQRAMSSADVILTPVSISLTHSAALASSLNTGRAIVMTAFQPEMLQRGGLMADFNATEKQCLAFASALTAGKQATITTAAGTNLTMSIDGRTGNAKTGLVRKAGEFSTIPDVEANVSPLEDTAEGTVIIDASIPYLGIGLMPSRDPVVLTIKAGTVTNITGGRGAGKKLWDAIKATGDPNGFNVAELGLGMNPRCRLIGMMLEDEGVAGTAHIGIGTSTNLGGKVQASSHYDAIMRDVTLVVDGKTLIQNGKLLTE